MDENPDTAPVLIPDGSTDPGPPDGWVASAPGAGDVDALADLLRRHETRVRGGSSASAESVGADVVGWGAATRRHRLVRDEQGAARGWASVHDRAAGRVLGAVVVDPDLSGERADRLAASLLAWTCRQAVAIGAARGLASTQLDMGAFEQDERQERWLAAASLELVRSWWQMSRPVTAAEGRPGVFAPPREGVVVRRVARAGDGMPDEGDLRAVHEVLEAAFADHFNNYAETFDEFCSRLRADPGHRWNHWWLAEIVDEGRVLPSGALVGEVSPGSDGGPDGSYVSYLGVVSSARGRGIARSLLHTVIADAAARGRNRVGLEVDADSPTGADGLYRSEGFVPAYTTQSWHLDLPVEVHKVP